MKSLLSFSRVLFATLTVALCAALFSCCPPQDPTKVIARLESETVSIVDEDGDMHCAGVWVSPTRILTAGHCVNYAGISDDEKEEREAFQALLDRAKEMDIEVDDVAPPPYNPVGHVVYYKTRADEPGADSKRAGQLIRFDEKLDLGLIEIGPRQPGQHPVATLRVEPPTVGDVAHIVGHPLNRLWSYSHGYVSKLNEQFISKPGSTWLQVDCEVNTGNSGGGIFDAQGRLEGIASFAARAGGLAWFVPQDTIRKFLTPAPVAAPVKK